MNGLFPDLTPGAPDKPARPPRHKVNCPKCKGWGEVNVVDPEDNVIWNAECTYCDAEGKVSVLQATLFNPAEHGPVGYDCEDSRLRALDIGRKLYPPNLRLTP